MAPTRIETSNPIPTLAPMALHAPNPTPSLHEHDVKDWDSLVQPSQPLERGTDGNPPGTSRRWNAYIAWLQRRIEQDWHNVILIRGEAGAGKSTIAQHVARALRPGFPVEHILYRPDQSHRLIHGLRREPIIFDEGANIAFSRTWNQEEQVSLIQMLQTCRQNNNTLIWCTLNDRRLDTVIRDDLVTSRITVVRRGEAWVERYHRDWHNEEHSWRYIIRPLYFPSMETIDPDFSRRYREHKRASFQTINAQGAIQGTSRSYRQLRQEQLAEMRELRLQKLRSKLGGKKTP
jgi:hypothetical protein